VLAHHRADLDLGYELKPPPGDADILSVPAIGEVVVEDDFRGFRGAGDRPFVADVDAVIGVGGE
jgi:hypothetical protein